MDVLYFNVPGIVLYGKISFLLVTATGCMHGSLTERDL